MHLNEMTYLKKNMIFILLIINNKSKSFTLQLYLNIEYNILIVII